MEPARRPAGRRALLPVEAEICNAVGLTEEEYWHFVDLTDAYAPDEKELRADPVTIISLVIGLALSAISALLAPKPQEPKQPINIKTEDIRGRSRFAPQANFDSVQELAKLGAVIPLIFARKGVRVTSTLLWSQMLSYGISQQLRVITLFGSGDIDGRPDWGGYAIGDTLLENYFNAKVALYFRPDGGRIRERSSDRYPQGTAAQVTPNDAFRILWGKTGNWEGYFSGTRTPNVQATFGVYSPVPNGLRYKVPYEVVVIPDEAESGVKDDLGEKKAKIKEEYPRRIAVTYTNANSIVLRINGSSWAGSRYEPHGIEDIKAAVTAGRVEADESFAVGNEYMIGTGLGVVTSVSSVPWEEGYTKDILLKWVEPGDIDIGSVNGTDKSFENLIIQRVAIGTVSNNRACECTEVGIKSTVYRQINGFANVNAYPGDDKISEIEADNGSFTLGSLQTYTTRLSFFTLQVRPLGVGASWKDITGGRLFCVKGQTPQPHYNYIKIYHSLGQYEFRLLPYAGNAAWRYHKNSDVWLLQPGEELSFRSKNFDVVFAGTRLHLDPTVTCNSEWILGRPPNPVGRVIGVNFYQRGPAVSYDWKYVNQSGRITRTEGQSWEYYHESRGYVGTLRSSLGGNANPPSEYLTLGSDRYKAGERIGSKTYRCRYESLEPSTPVTFSGDVTATGGRGSGLVFSVTAYANGFRKWSIKSGGSKYRNGDSVYLPVANVQLRITSDVGDLLKNNFNEHDAISDFVTYQLEKASHMEGPEHEIVYINEQISQATPQYDKLAISGMRIDSTKEWTTFSNLSAFFKKGIRVERLTTGGRSATNLLPEIAYALLTDPVIGAGSSIGKSQVDRDRMAIAARFCEANNFTWDGVIDERLNLREWIFENAGYCLLDFTILGGRFSLVPSVPFNKNYTINRNGKPDIKALFTDGNIRNLKVSFLNPEERQLFRAVVTWRQDKINGFPETRTVAVRLSNAQGGSDADPEESFDMAGFCTSQEHALTFAKYALKIRKEIDHGLTFETTPQAAMNLTPGDYFRLSSEVTHTSRFNNGSIGPDGSIQSADKLDGTYPILFWKPGTVGVQSGELIATGNKTDQASLFGTVFTLNNSTLVDRVYKCESLSYAEDGLVEVAASHTPLTALGSLKVLQWPGEDFEVEVG